MALVLPEVTFLHERFLGLEQQRAELAPQPASGTAQQAASPAATPVLPVRPTANGTPKQYEMPTIRTLMTAGINVDDRLREKWAAEAAELAELMRPKTLAELLEEKQRRANERAELREAAKQKLLAELRAKVTKTESELGISSKIKKDVKEGKARKREVNDNEDEKKEKMAKTEQQAELTWL